MKIYRFDAVTSTQVVAKEYPPGSVIIANEQTAARGRFKREWVAGKGGLWMSMVLAGFTKQTQQVTFMAAVAVVNALNDFGVKAQIKWPNDVLLKGKKLGGILTEGIFGVTSKLIVGIGVNVKNEPPVDLNAANLIGKPVNVKDLSGAILRRFGELKSVYEKYGFGPILNMWRDNSHTIGKRINVTSLRETLNGIAVDVDASCRLHVKVSTGEIKKVVEGDIKLL